MVIKFTLTGQDEVLRDFKDFISSGERSINGFFNMVESTSINLLKANTPVDTGELKSSWRVLSRNLSGPIGSTNIGVREDQEEKLRYVTFGTRYIPKNNFVEAAEVLIQGQVSNFLGMAFEQAHRWYRESGLTRELKRANIGKIPGAGTGTNYNKRRSTGSFGLKRPNKGFKTLNRRIGLKSRRVTGL